MQYSLTIREYNKQAHIDIDKSIIKKRDGLFTFVIRVNKGNIVDYIEMENDTYRDFEISYPC